MKVASIQLDLNDARSKEQVVEYALGMMDKCRGYDLLILPELWNIGFANYDKFHAESEPIDGYTASAIAQKARELGAYVHGGSFVEKRGGKYHNTSVLFDRKGALIGAYRKVHLFTYQSREPELLTPGSGISVIETEFGKMGLSTCYDLRFPEFYRKMADVDVDFILVPACWPYPRNEAWDVLNQARALENTCFLISCNAAGGQCGVMYLGHSKIVDPWGTVVAGSSFREAIVTAEIDPGLVKRVRAAFPVLKDRVIK